MRAPHLSYRRTHRSRATAVGILAAAAVLATGCLTQTNGTTFSGASLGRKVTISGTLPFSNHTVQIQVLEDPTASTNTWTTLATVTTGTDVVLTWSDGTELYGFSAEVVPVANASQASRWAEGGIAKFRARFDLGTLGTGTTAVLDDIQCMNDNADLPYLNALQTCQSYSVGTLTVVDTDDAAGDTPNPTLIPFLGRKTSPASDTDAYYTNVGALNADGTPSSARGTFSQWYNTNDFDQATGTIHATYYNTADLGFGRDMYCRTTTYGKACYVTNYGNVEDGLADKNSALNDAVSGNNPAATVAMEWHSSAASTDNPVRFFVYDTSATGAGALIKSIALDSGEAKAIPGLCVACHGGTYNSANARVDGAQFLPFDIDLFDYHASKTKADQASELRDLNLLVRDTLQSTDASYQLISGWYPTNTSDFDSAHIPAAWQGSLESEALYTEVYRHYCQVCHNSQPSAPKTYTDFVNQKSTIQSTVCSSSFYMPNAEVTFDSFWKSGARAHLIGALDIRDNCDAQ